MKYTDAKMATYVKYRADLVNYVTRLTGCRFQAEDLVQDAFFRFVPDTAGAPPESGVAYLYRIVRNLAIDLARRTAMEARHQDEHVVAWLKPREQDSPEQTLLQHDQLDRVCTLLDQLPLRERLAIEMHRIGGYTFAEIAERLDVSIPTVYRLVRNAVARLAASLD